MSVMSPMQWSSCFCRKHSLQWDPTRPKQLWLPTGTRRRGASSRHIVAEIRCRVTSRASKCMRWETREVQVAAKVVGVAETGLWTRVSFVLRKNTSGASSSRRHTLRRRRTITLIIGACLPWTWAGDPDDMARKKTWSITRSTRGPFSRRCVCVCAARICQITMKHNVFCLRLEAWVHSHTDDRQTQTRENKMGVTRVTHGLHTTNNCGSQELRI